jgi:transcriptional regulator with XRE-family HTH domain
LLQRWRRLRRKSQLALALEADVSARHLGFVESGRANPSREMVLLLARALDVPLRERNELLVAAGYAPMYRETGLAAPELSQARKALEYILRQQEPYPAVVMDRHWNVVMTNAAAQRFFGALGGARPDGPANIMRLMFHPDALRPFVGNWPAVAEALVQRLHREAVGGVADDETLQLLEEVLAYPGVPHEWRTPGLEATALPFLPIEFHAGELVLKYFSTVTTLGTPLDITLQEIRIESFHPADETTERYAREIGH